MDQLIASRAPLRNRRLLAAQAWDLAVVAVRAAAESFDARCEESVARWRAACAREESAYEWWWEEFNAG